MQKKEAIEKLEEAMAEGKVDEKVKPLLSKLNSLPAYHTTSSCAGRIHVYEISKPGAKNTLKTLGKWHGKVSQGDFKAALSKHKSNQLWLKVSPPIIHVGCSNLESAEKLLKCSYASGFKYSALKNINPPLVEIATTESMEVPLGNNGSIEVPDSYVSSLSKIANQKLIKSQSKLHRLLKNLK